jgi:hypothetical protein
MDLQDLRDINNFMTDTNLQVLAYSPKDNLNQISDRFIIVVSDITAENFNEAQEEGICQSLEMMLAQGYKAEIIINLTHP